MKGFTEEEVAAFDAASNEIASTENLLDYNEWFFEAHIDTPLGPLGWWYTERDDWRIMLKGRRLQPLKGATRVKVAPYLPKLVDRVRAVAEAAERA